VGGSSSGDTNCLGCAVVIEEAAVLLAAPVTDKAGDAATPMDASTAAALAAAVVGVDAADCDCADALIAWAAGLEEAESAPGAEEEPDAFDNDDADSCTFASFFLCRGPSKCLFDLYRPPLSSHNEHDQFDPSFVIHFDIAIVCRRNQ